ncbi:MAG TPA: hypothetical protein VGR64_02210 [Terracidiphilus sp.]|nr:hypothetical protein [Terracidiphilus sp.]
MVAGVEDYALMGPAKDWRGEVRTRERAHRKMARGAAEAQA